MSVTGLVIPKEGIAFPSSIHHGPYKVTESLQSQEPISENIREPEKECQFQQTSSKFTI